MSNQMSTVFIGYISDIILVNGKPNLELKIRVPSIHGISSKGGIKDSDLPTAKPMVMPGLEYNEETFLETVKKLNKVYVIFESGDLNKPIYFGLKANGDIYNLPAQSVFIRTYDTYLDLPTDGSLSYLYRVLDTGVLYMWDPVHNQYTNFVVPSIATSSIWFDPASGLSQGDITDVGRLFYNIERHTLTFLTDLGEYLEIGSNLGDFGKNDNGPTYEGAPVGLTGVQGSSPIKLFEPASASDNELSKMVGVLTTSDNNGVLTPGALGKVSVFGDVKVPSWENILDSNFLSDMGISNISDIPVGTKLYLSTEYGRYSALPQSKPNVNIWMATVVYMSPSGNHGRIFVYPHRENGIGGDTLVGTVTAYTNTGPNSGLREIDGIQLKTNDKVLMIGIVGIDNGIYSVGSGIWVKMMDILDNSVVSIDQGLIYAGTMLKVVSNTVTIVKKSELTKWATA